MLAELTTLLAVAGLSGVQAQEVYQCNGLLQPNWDSCDGIMASIPWKNTPEDGPNIADQACIQYTDLDGGNCVIHACNDRRDGQTQPLNVFSGPTWYGQVKEFCGVKQSAGGRAPGGPSNGVFVEVTRNDAQTAPAKRAASRAARRATTGQVSSKLVTIKEFEAFREKAKNITAAKWEDPSFKTSKGPEVSGLQRRQATWTNIGTSRNVRQPGVRDQMSGPTDSGVSLSVSTTEGYSTSVSVSADLGVSFLEIFSASVGVDVTSETSVQYSYTRTFNPADRCTANQQGVLYFYPSFDKYEGIWSDREGSVEVFVPLENAPPDYDIECLG